MTSRNKTWINAHLDDSYVKRANREGWRSRAVFKLQELDEKYHLFKKGITVVDLGAAPGSWSQYVAKSIGSQGKIIAVDILEMDAIPGVTFLQGDFTEPEILESLMEILGQNKIDLVLSDMAPNISGIDSVDQPRAICLAELAAEFAQQALAANGSLLVKVFYGAGFEDYVKMLRNCFYKVLIRKPEASRPRSREVYVLATKMKL